MGASGVQLLDSICRHEQEGSLRERKPTDIKSALTASYESEHDDKEPEEHCLEITGAPLEGPDIGGAYHQSSVHVNGRAHYERRRQRGTSADTKRTFRAVHLYWTGKQWVLSSGLNTTPDMSGCLGYCKRQCHARSYSTIDCSITHVNVQRGAFDNSTLCNAVPLCNRLAVTLACQLCEHSSYRVLLLLKTVSDIRYVVADDVMNIMIKCKQSDIEPAVQYFDINGESAAATQHQQQQQKQPAEVVSDRSLMKKLLPLYIIFVMDAICSGIALPALPFFVMSLGATAFQCHCDAMLAACAVRSSILWCSKLLCHTRSALELVFARKQ
eukprot:3825-Heterococcus_DN1.PRE.1